jgi:membrane AbrB-like protein
VDAGLRRENATKQRTRFSIPADPRGARRRAYVIYRGLRRRGSGALLTVRQLRDGAFTLAAGTAGAFAMHVLHFPAAWLSGSMLLVAALALARAPLFLPEPVRQLVWVMLGISIGSGFTPEILGKMLHWPLSIAGLGVTILFGIAASATFLVGLAKWSRTTAFFASIPGALSYVIALSLRSTADTRLVVMAQMLRLVSVLAILPSIVSLSMPPPHLVPTEISGAAGFILELALGGAIALVLRWRNFAAAALFGGMIAAAILHLSSAVAGQIPPAILVPCQIVLGCFIGLRFYGTNLAFLRKALVPSFGAFLIALLVSSLGAFIVATGLHLPLGQVVVAFAPGGIEAMTILAFVLGLDPAFVATHQLARFLGLSLMLPVIARFYLKE